MDDAQKKPQNQTQNQDQNTVIPSAPSIAREKEIPVPVDVTPSMSLDEELEKAGVELVENPELPPHEIIKNNIEIPTLVISQQPVQAPSVQAPIKAKILKIKRKKLYTDPKEANAWKEEVEIREDLKKAD